MQESFAIEKFCSSHNIFYEKSPGSRTVQRKLVYCLSQSPDMKMKFENFDFFKEIEQITVETECSILTFRVGWKHHQDHFKPESEYKSIQTECVKFFKKISKILATFEGKYAVLLRHKCTAVICDLSGLIPQLTYWELVCSKPKF